MPLFPPPGNTGPLPPVQVRTYTAIPVLDGVEAWIYITNRSAQTYVAPLAGPGVTLTNDMNGNPRVVEAQPIGGWGSGLLTAEEVSGAQGSGYTKLRCHYSGGSIPAQLSGAQVSGFLLFEHEWGWAHTDPSWNPSQQPSIGGFQNSTPFPAYFVPFFKAVAASTTPAVSLGGDTIWNLYFAKPLNWKQAAALAITVTTPMFGGSTNLAFTTILNAHGQPTGLAVTLPFSSKTVTALGTNTIHVTISQSLYYLKADAFTTETLTFIDSDFSVTVGASSDATPPVISSFTQLITTPAPGINGEFYDPTARTFAGQVVFTVVASDTGGSGLGHVELWKDGVQLDAAVTVTGTPGTYSKAYPTATSPHASWTNGVHTMAAKVYDGAGNVTSSTLSFTLANPAFYSVNLQDQVNSGDFTVSAPDSPLPASGGDTTILNPSGSLGGIGAAGLVMDNCQFLAYVDCYVDGVNVGSVAASVAVKQDATKPNLRLFKYSFPTVSNNTNHTIEFHPYWYANQPGTPGQSAGNMGGVLRIPFQAAYSYIRDPYQYCVPLYAPITGDDGVVLRAETLHDGQLVLSKGPNGLCYKPIKNVQRHTAPMVRLTLENGISVVSSDTHPYGVAPATPIPAVLLGPVFEGFLSAQDIQVGMCVEAEDGGYLLVETKTALPPEEVVSFEVEDTHTFYSYGILSHNKGVQQKTGPLT